MVMSESMIILGLVVSLLACSLIFAGMFFAVRFIFPRLKNNSKIKSSKFLSSHSFSFKAADTLGCNPTPGTRVALWNLNTADYTQKRLTQNGNVPCHNSPDKY